MGLALPNLLQGQSLLERFRAPVRTPVGIDLYYGLSLGAGPTIYNGGVGTTSVGDRAVLRLAVSPSGYATADFATPSVRLNHATTVGLTARAFADHGKFSGLGRGETATVSSSPMSYYQYEITPTIAVTGWSNRLMLSGGPVFKYTRMRVVPVLAWAQDSAPLAFGFGSGTGYGQIGLGGDLTVTVGAPRCSSAILVNVGGAAYAPMWGVSRPLTEVYARASGFVRLPLPQSPSLHLRAGAMRVVGDVPVHELVHLGGSELFRGAATDRFAGDAMAYGSAELRVPVARPTAFGRSAQFGVLGFADAGRIEHTGVAGTGWMAAVGGGAWIKPDGGTSTFSAGLANGPLGSRFYFRTDVGF
jgi:hypothetical protein